MVRVIANAVRQRIRVPEHDVTIRMQDGALVTVTATQLADARRSVPRNGTFHANREPFLRRVLDHLSRNRARSLGEDPGDPDIRQARLSDLVDDTEVRRTLNLMWLPTTPERLVRRLLSDPATLAAAAAGLLTASSSAPSSARPTRRGRSTTCRCSTRPPSGSAILARPRAGHAARRGRLRRARRGRPVRRRHDRRRPSPSAPWPTARGSTGTSSWTRRRSCPAWRGTRCHGAAHGAR